MAGLELELELEVLEGLDVEGADGGVLAQPASSAVAISKTGKTRANPGGACGGS